MLICLLGLVMITACSKETPTEIKMITPEEMESLLELEDVQLVDVRTPKEYETGFIAHSQNIDFNSPTFDEDIEKLDKTQPVILYCKSGGRSAKCAEKLKAAGFVKIYDLEGGITHWRHEKLEVKTFD
ncbi:rhodanese-like domain-containing protein [Sediminibacter sp. Hel_I_10]|uniref:rhodanese-like domain-containing protein n=1 Tax=Sediminibacter sp. Hel_I_10 TaxID=1392490 RepID=UPI0005642C2A|nr:rhodanese-like domain-containing protein [Sediminibacter sp. Hel_I_10]